MTFASITPQKSWVRRMAQAGLISKGIVYVILGIMAFMAAFELRGQDTQNADQSGVFRFIREAPAGSWLLIVLAAGLICYTLWRLLQAFNIGATEKSSAKRVRYGLSGITYAAVAFSAIKVVLKVSSDSGGGNERMAGQAMSLPFGTWVVGAGALLFAGIGAYQIYYALSEKYKKHVQRLSLHSRSASLLVSAGKAGYLARGTVWLIIAYLLLRSALHANAGEAGNSAKAFQWIESVSYGSFLLGCLGLGVIAYGIFNFIRARYDRL